ncbi:MAG: putative sulfate exporter family transporter [Planctomycetota bacterium]
MSAARDRTAWAVALGLALLAIVLRPALGESRLVPSASVLALVLGMVVGAIPPLRDRVAAGAGRVAKQAIPVAIVLIGFGLDLGPLVGSGAIGGSLVVVVVAMVVAFVSALIAGRLFGLDPRASLLLGAGTAVCGNSAIMAVAPTVQPDDEDIGLSIGAINLLGVLMLVVLPPIATSLGIVGREGGSLAGLTVHAVPQAIATGEAFGAEGLEWATLFKLLRVAMLVPLVVALALTLARVRASKGEGSGSGPGIPWFVVLFVVAAGLRATGWFDAEVAVAGDERALWAWLQSGGRIVLAAALAAIGVGLQLGTLLRVGPSMLAAGALTVTAMVAATIPLVRWLFD